MVDLPDPASYLDEVGAIVDALSDLGLQPVLVGGMALVILGSRRVTRDFDFVVARPAERLRDLLAVFYDRRLELASSVNDAGEVTATVGSRRIAAARLRLDAPSSAYFFNRRTGLRIDLLFDFPIAAATLARDTTPITVRSHVLPVASARDLLRLKRIAHKQRATPGDAQDVAFLETYLERS
jgi:hypothetical protein